MKLGCVMALAVLVVGCGDDAGSGGGGASGTSGFAKGAERDAYRDSKGLCRDFPIRQTAREYGGGPSEPASVAEAYAKQAYVPRFYGAAFDGLKSR